MVLLGGVGKRFRREDFVGVVPYIENSNTKVLLVFVIWYYYKVSEQNLAEKILLE